MEKDIWQTTTMTDFYAANKLDFTFSSLISDYHTLERNIRLFTGLPKYVTRQLSPTEINTLQRLHERGKDTLTMLAEKHTRLSSNFAVLQTENERYERDFQAVFSIVTKLNPTEQYLPQIQ